MYTGPGSGPMLAAAAAWDGLAAELYSTATSYSSVIEELQGPWSGTSSAAMAAAAASYVEWLSTAAAQAEQVCTHAKAAAVAYEAAFAMTVPPPVIAANRALLAVLIATNFFGQNTSAIAATEAHYTEMWAQDAAAMYSYAGDSAAASTIGPFTPAQPTTNAAGTASQDAAVEHAINTSAAGHTQTIVATAQQSMAIPTTLQALASPSTPSVAPGISQILGDLLNFQLPPIYDQFNLFSAAVLSWPTALPSIWPIAAINWALKGAAGPAPVSAAAAGSTASNPTSSALRPGGGEAPVAAGVGQATTVGRLSVPQGWAEAAPAMHLAAAAARNISLDALAADVTQGLSGGIPIIGAPPLTRSSQRGVGGADARSRWRPPLLKMRPRNGSQVRQAT